MARPVDNEEIVIFIDNVQRDILCDGLAHAVDGSRQDDVDHIAWFDLVIGLDFNDDRY